MAKQTFLYNKHIEQGAKMVDFVGWNMPVQYISILEEHKSVRNNVGIFDVSHMGEIIIQGKDSVDFLNKIVPQDISKLQNTKAVYCQLTNNKGGVVDDLIIYKLEDYKYLIIANASRVDEDINWLSLNSKNFNVDIINESHNYSLIAVQGPKTCSLMKKLGIENLPSFFSIKKDIILGVDLWVSRTGYTGEDGVELLIPNKNVVFIWDKLLELGQEFNIRPIGLGARDTLRLEASMLLYGNDLDEETTPIEAGLSWSIPKDKLDFYNGKEIIEYQLKNGTEKKLIGFKMLDKNIARHGYDVYYNNEKIGVVTSGSVSPTRGDYIGLAYIKNIKELIIGTNIQILIREKFYNAEIIKRPFIEKRNKI